MPLPRALARPSSPLDQVRPPARPFLRPVAPPPPRSPLRRSLRASTAEGIAAEVVGAATSTAAVTAWALHLGCGAAVIAVLGAMPFLAHVLQLPAAALTARLGARRVALTAVAVSRLAYLPLVLIPFLGVSPTTARAALLGAAAVHHGLGIVCNNGWVAWMGEIVPARLRGRYFGRRTAVCTLAAAIAGLAIGALLDRAPGGRAVTLSILAALTCVTGAVSTAVMARQHGGLRACAARARRFSFRAVLRGRAPRRWAVLQAVCGVASGLAVPFFGVFVLRDRALGFAFLAAYGVIGAIARTAAAPTCGRWTDRPGGARRVVILANALAVAGPLLWIASARAGAALLLVEGALGGIAAAGTGVAGLVFPLSLSDDVTRPAYHAVFAVAGGLAFGVGAAAGAALAGAAGAGVAGPFTVPFAACAVLRLGAVGLSRRLPDVRLVAR